MESRNEIQDIFLKYNISLDTTLTNDTNLIWLIENLSKTIPFEKPDGYIKKDTIVYGIEHFKVSQYENTKKGDISKIVEGDRNKRANLKETKSYEFNPQIDNFFASIIDNLSKHSKSFKAYLNNINKTFPDKNIDIKLVILMEDISQNGVVKKCDTKPINPLLLDRICFIFEQYAEYLYGIILIHGNEKQKKISGITLKELKEMRDKNQLLNSLEYDTFVLKHTEKVDRENPNEDSISKTIVLCDRFGF